MAIYRLPVDLAWNGSGSPGVNVFHVQTGDNPTLTGVETIAALLRQFYVDISTALAGPMTASFAGEAVEVDTDVRAPVPAWTYTTAATNQYAAFPLALTISWRTTLATRAATGRTFIGPLAAAVDGNTGVPPAATTTLIQTAANDLLADIRTAEGEGGSRLVVYSRLNGSATTILNARVRQTFSVLRSRRD